MKNIFFVLISSAFLFGCAPLILGTGAATSYVAVQERTFEEAGEDILLKTKLLERIGRLSPAYVKDLNIRVRFGEAFITGVVEEESEIGAITQTANQVGGVKKVINAVQLKPYPFKQHLKDTATSANLRSRLLLTKDVYTANYEITIVKSEVYLFGWAFTQAEINKAVHVTSTTKGVAKVHNYLRILPDGPEKLKEIKRREKAIQDESYGVDEVN